MKFNSFIYKITILAVGSITLFSALAPFKSTAASNLDPVITVKSNSIMGKENLISNNDLMIDTRTDDGRLLEYDASSGEAVLSRNGRTIKNFSGWRTGWNIIEYLGKNMFVFYQTQQGKGYAEIYRIDRQGNMSHLKTYENWSHLVSISAEPRSNTITVQSINGDTGTYYVDRHGSWHDKDGDGY